MSADYMKDLPEEWQQIYEERQLIGWVKNTKLTLDWFLSYISPESWDARKKNVVRYFKRQHNLLLEGAGNAALAMEEESARIAFHEDWMAWYLYIIESIHERPVVDELYQGSRIYPFFSAIGRHIELAKKIKGIDSKLHEILNGKNNQPDATLFEIMVAITYARNGWVVEFIPEKPTEKTPDLLVRKGGVSFYVECKRQSKVTGYSEEERKEWRARWMSLMPALMYFGNPVFIDVTFKTEVASTDRDIVKKSFLNIMLQGRLVTERTFEDATIKVGVRPINLAKVNAHFTKYFVRLNSPQFVSLLSGGFKSSDNYTHVTSPIDLVTVGPEDDYHALNVFCTGLNTAYCARWVCIAEESIDKKAKDVKKLLSKAVSQAPEEMPTIVHIAYETLHGPHIEFQRADKIIASLAGFDCKGKNICAIYCHAIQPSVSEDDWEIAETTTRFGRHGILPELILPHDLLFDEADTQIRNDTHWNEDLNAEK